MNLTPKAIGLVTLVAVMCPALLKAQPFPVVQRTQSAWEIVPCSNFGPIQATTSVEDLVRLFGKENVQDVRIEGPEGETYPGTVIFPTDPTKKLQILWKDAVTRRGPVEISLSGDRSLWKTANGVTLGTRIKDLEKLNGGPFTISGFSWDYGGHVVSWDGGALTKTFNHKLGLLFDPGSSPAVTEGDLKTVSGDRQLKSSLPVLQRMNPKVIEISCAFQ